MINYIIFGISVSFFSWIIGIVLNTILMMTRYYERLSYMNFIESKTINKYLGLRYFKWIVKNTFFKYFNPGIKIRSRSTDLTEIRRQMTIAEIGHLIGFLFVLVFAIYWSIVHGLLFGLVIMMANVFMNLYPSLLQQENKRRIDKVINRLQIDKS